MTSVQLRYAGSLVGLDWLVADLLGVGLDPRFPPVDRAQRDTPGEEVELVLDLQHTGDEGRLQAISDPGGLEAIDNAIASFSDRFEYAATTPVVTIVGVQSNPSTAAAVVLKNPNLAFCTDVECRCEPDEFGCEEPAPAAARLPTPIHQPPATDEPEPSSREPAVVRGKTRWVTRLWTRVKGC